MVLDRFVQDAAATAGLQPADLGNWQTWCDGLLSSLLVGCVWNAVLPTDG